MLDGHLEECPRGDFVCFRPDGRKAGKYCVSVIGEVRRIDEIPGQIILLIGERYPFTASASSAILKVPFSPSGRFLILAVACPKEKRCVSECLYSATPLLACPAVACLFFRMKRQRFFPSAARKSRKYRSLQTTKQ